MCEKIEFHAKKNVFFPILEENTDASPYNCIPAFDDSMLMYVLLSEVSKFHNKVLFNDLHNIATLLESVNITTYKIPRCMLNAHQKHEKVCI